MSIARRKPPVETLNLDWCCADVIEGQIEDDMLLMSFPLLKSVIIGDRCVLNIEEIKSLVSRLPVTSINLSCASENWETKEIDTTRTFLIPLFSEGPDTAISAAVELKNSLQNDCPDIVIDSLIHDRLNVKQWRMLAHASVHVSQVDANFASRLRLGPNDFEEYASILNSFHPSIRYHLSVGSTWLTPSHVKLLTGVRIEWFTVYWYNPLVADFFHILRKMNQKPQI